MNWGRTFLTMTAPLLAGLLIAASPALAEDASEDDGWEVLFDGTNTDAFRGYNKEAFPNKGWLVEDGTLRIKAGSWAGDIITKKKYRDFDLRWEWKVSKGANSGVMYRVAEVKQPSSRSGPEFQILDDVDYGQLKTDQLTGALCDVIACNDQKALYPTGQWNTGRILMHKDEVQHFLNDKLVVAYQWRSDKILDLISKTKFKDWPLFMTQDAGHIAFQDHGKDVWFRNIKIKDLSDKGDEE